MWKQKKRKKEEKEKKRKKEKNSCAIIHIFHIWYIYKHIITIYPILPPLIYCRIGSMRTHHTRLWTRHETDEDTEHKDNEDTEDLNDNEDTEHKDNEETIYNWNPMIVHNPIAEKPKSYQNCPSIWIVNLTPICYGNLCYQYQICSLPCIQNWIRYRGSLFPHFRSPRAWILYHLCIASPPRPFSPPRYWRDSRGAWSNCGTRTRYVSLSLTWWQRRQPLSHSPASTDSSAGWQPVSKLSPQTNFHLLE